MKISVLCLVAFFCASAALADGTLSVKINSFNRINNDPTNTLCEICGVVTVNADVMPAIANLIPVTITSDPGNNPGNYTVLADQNGDFCSVINSYTGNASATAWLPHGDSAASPVAKVGTTRK